MKLSTSIFHFNCSFCGAHPREVPLIEFVERWHHASDDDFDTLVASYAAIVRQLCQRPRKWGFKTLLAVLAKVSDSLAGLRQAPASLSKVDESGDPKSATCPFCGTPPGCRPEDRYFTRWPDACGVQIANVLYEANIVFFAVARALPQWADPPILGRIGRLLQLNHKALQATGMLECPRCGRRTTCLYGTGDTARCRWCLDTEPPTVIRLTLTPQGTITVADGSLDGPNRTNDESVTPSDQTRSVLDGMIPFREARRAKNRQTGDR